MNRYSKKFFFIFLCAISVFFIVGCGTTADVVDLDEVFNAKYEAGEKYEFKTHQAVYQFSLSREDSSCYMISREEIEGAEEVGDFTEIDYYEGTYSTGDVSGEIICEWNDVYRSVETGANFSEIAARGILMLALGSGEMSQKQYDTMCAMYFDGKTVRIEKEDDSLVKNLKVQLGNDGNILSGRVETARGDAIAEVIEYDGTSVYITSYDSFGEKGRTVQYTIDGIMLSRCVYFGSDSEKEDQIWYAEEYYLNGSLKSRKDYDQEEGYLTEMSEYYETKSVEEEPILKAHTYYHSNGEVASFTEYNESGVEVQRKEYDDTGKIRIHSIVDGLVRKDINYYLEFTSGAILTEWYNMEEGKTTQVQLADRDGNVLFECNIKEIGQYFDLTFGGSSDKCEWITVTLKRQNDTMAEYYQYDDTGKLMQKQFYDEDEKLTETAITDENGKYLFSYKIKEKGNNVWWRSNDKSIYYCYEIDSTQRMVRWSVYSSNGKEICTYFVSDSNNSLGIMESDSEMNYIVEKNKDGKSIAIVAFDEKLNVYAVHKVHENGNWFPYYPSRFAEDEIIVFSELSSKDERGGYYFLNKRGIVLFDYYSQESTYYSWSSSWKSEDFIWTCFINNENEDVLVDVYFKEDSAIAWVNNRASDGTVKSVTMYRGNKEMATYEVGGASRRFIGVEWDSETNLFLFFEDGPNGILPTFACDINGKEVKSPL